MIILVTGGRDFEDMEVVEDVLSEFESADLLIHGGARGADRLAGFVAARMGIHVAEVRANWNVYGRRAGHLRNAAMLRLKPDLLLAFPGGRGTGNCISQAEEAGITVRRIKSREKAPRT